MAWGEFLSELEPSQSCQESGSGFAIGSEHGFTCHICHRHAITPGYTTVMGHFSFFISRGTLLSVRERFSACISRRHFLTNWVR